MSIGSNIIQAIGNTSLVKLRNVVPPGYAKIFAKLEWENPTGSMKNEKGVRRNFSHNPHFPDGCLRTDTQNLKNRRRRND
jgi:hypothetical protein